MSIMRNVLPIIIIHIFAIFNFFLASWWSVLLVIVDMSLFSCILFMKSIAVSRCNDTLHNRTSDVSSPLHDRPAHCLRWIFFKDLEWFSDIFVSALFVHSWNPMQFFCIPTTPVFSESQWSQSFYLKSVSSSSVSFSWMTLNSVHVCVVFPSETAASSDTPSFHLFFRQSSASCRHTPTSVAYSWLPFHCLVCLLLGSLIARCPNVRSSFSNGTTSITRWLPDDCVSAHLRKDLKIVSWRKLNSIRHAGHPALKLWWMNNSESVVSALDLINYSDNVVAHQRTQFQTETG